jgi:hypothetical protein
LLRRYKEKGSGALVKGLDEYLKGCESVVCIVIVKAMAYRAIDATMAGCKGRRIRVV